MTTATTTTPTPAVVDETLTEEQKAAQAAEAATAAAAAEKNKPAGEVVIPEVTPSVDNPEKWEPSGDATVDSLAKGYLAKGGTAAEFEAMLEDVGNTGKLTAGAKAALTKAFGDLAPALIEPLEAKAAQHLEWVTNERNAIYKAAGSEAEFTAMQKWTKENLDDATRGFLTSALQLGGQSALMAIEQTKQLMIKKGATVTTTTHEVNGAVADAGGNIGLADYIKEKETLLKKGDTAGVTALEQRARQSMAAATAQGRRWR